MPTAFSCCLQTYRPYSLSAPGLKTLKISNKPWKWDSLLDSNAKILVKNFLAKTLLYEHSKCHFLHFQCFRWFDDVATASAVSVQSITIDRGVVGGVTRQRCYTIALARQMAEGCSAFCCLATKIDGNMFHLSTTCTTFVPKQCTVIKVVHTFKENFSVVSTLSTDTTTLQELIQLSRCWLSLVLHHILLRSEIPSGICAKLRTVAASNNRVHMPWSLCYWLFTPHICMVLFFTHIPFVVNHSINATPLERLQQYQAWRILIACAIHRTVLLYVESGGSLNRSLAEGQFIFKNIWRTIANNTHFFYCRVSPL